ncbi:hypothetical protein SLT36_21430 [Aminobacter sp. BA135]|uniref:imine reductase family protein n=1 Tax=Aminobacter sp. BA135 TaxID=537596 RepID=UPI003D7AAD3E
MAGSAPLFADDMRRMARVIATNSFSAPESTIASVRADIARLVDVSDDLGIGADLPNFAASVFQRAVDAGYGAEEHCAITKVLRSPSFKVALSRHATAGGLLASLHRSACNMQSESVNPIQLQSATGSASRFGPSLCR